MRYVAPLASVIAAVALGSSHVVEKVAITGGASPQALAAGRGAAALALVGLAWLVFHLRARAELPERRCLVQVAGIGVVASGVVILIAIVALRDTTATNKGVVQALYPLGTAVFAAWLLGERIGARGWVAFAAMTVGLALLMTDGFGGLPRTGDWLLLVTVPLIGSCDAWSKRTLGGVDAMTMAAGRQLFGFAFLAAALVVLDPGDLVMLGAMWPWVFAAGGLAGIFAIAFYVAVQQGAVSLAAALLALAPVLTALLEWLVLGNAPGSWQLLGLGMVVAGSLAAAWIQGRDA